MFLSSQLLAAALAPKGVGQYIRQHFLDKTFQGLYQPNAIMILITSAKTNQ